MPRTMLATVTNRSMTATEGLLWNVGHIDVLAAANEREAPVALGGGIDAEGCRHQERVPVCEPIPRIAEITDAQAERLHLGAP